jgi:hypothetical protein
MIRPWAGRSSSINLHVPAGTHGKDLYPGPEPLRSTRPPSPPDHPAPHAAGVKAAEGAREASRSEAESLDAGEYGAKPWRPRRKAPWSCFYTSVTVTFLDQSHGPQFSRA